MTDSNLNLLRYSLHSAVVKNWDPVPSSGGLGADSGHLILPREHGRVVLRQLKPRSFGATKAFAERLPFRLKTDFYLCCYPCSTLGMVVKQGRWDWLLPLVQRVVGCLLLQTHTDLVVER